jgi:hypothetical protein
LLALCSVIRKIPGITTSTSLATAPLTVRRHAGSTDLQQIAEELLGLSKMNWNTADLCTKLPATLQSSTEIARIGSLLQKFGASSFDYRLFI